MGTWSSHIGKFKKKDPDHGWLARWLKDNWKAFWEAEGLFSWGRCKKGRCSCKCRKEGK